MIFKLFYVDDGALMFNSRSEAILGTNMIYEQMKMMGFKVHVRQDKIYSKTNAIYFSCRLNFFS